MKTSIRMVSALVVAVLLFVTQPALAETSIAIVNIKKIVDESLAAKNIAKQVEAKRDAYQKEVTAEEEKLREEDQELAKQRTVLSKEAFEQRAKEFRSKVIEAQRKVQARRTKLENAYVKALKKVREVTLTVINEQAEQKNFAVALPKSQVLYSEGALDISQDVLRELNKRLPKVDVVIEE